MELMKWIVPESSHVREFFWNLLMGTGIKGNQCNNKKIKISRENV